MKNIILMLTLNIVFYSSMWNCNDKFDEMCEEYPQLLLNLFKPQFNENDNIKTENIIPNDDVINNIKKGLWALFEITLVDNSVMEKDMDNNENLLGSIVNSDFLKENPYLFISLFRRYDISNKVYLFVSDINIVTIDVIQPYKHVSLFREVKVIKKVKVMYSNCPQKESHSAYVGCIAELFRDCTNLEEVNLENLNLNYLGVSGLFAGCENLKEVKLQRIPLAKVYKNDDNESIVLMFARIFYDNIPHKTIKVSCTDQLCYKLLWDREMNKVEIESYYNDNNNKIVIKDELKDSICYRDFHIYLDELNQSYMIKKDEV